MISWDDLNQDDDFLIDSEKAGQDVDVIDLENHNREIKACLLSDPDCESCQ